VIEDVRITKDFNASTHSSQVGQAPSVEGGRTDILEKLLPPLMSFVQVSKERSHRLCLF
jgi:hypothetical protein